MGEENTVPDWMQSVELSDDLKSSKVLLDTPDIPTLAKRLVDNHAMVGRSIRLPGEHATDEDRAKFNTDLLEKVPGLMPTPDLNDEEAVAQLFQRLGKPEEADKYEVPEFETHGMQTDNSVIERLGPIAHKYHLTQKQFSGIVKEISEGNIQQALEIKQNHDKDMANLKIDWGTNFDARMDGLVNMLKSTDAPEGLQKAVQDGMVDVPTLKWLHGVKKLFGSEGSELVNQDTDKEPGMDATEAQARADEIMAQLQDLAPSDPKYKSLMQRRVELIAIASGKK